MDNAILDQAVPTLQELTDAMELLRENGLSTVADFCEPEAEYIIQAFSGTSGFLGPFVHAGWEYRSDGIKVIRRPTSEPSTALNNRQKGAALLFSEFPNSGFVLPEPVIADDDSRLILFNGDKRRFFWHQVQAVLRLGGVHIFLGEEDDCFTGSLPFIFHGGGQGRLMPTGMESDDA